MTDHFRSGWLCNWHHFVIVFGEISQNNEYQKKIPIHTGTSLETYFLFLTCFLLRHIHDDLFPFEIDLRLTCFFFRYILRLLISFWDIFTTSLFPFEIYLRLLISFLDLFTTYLFPFETHLWLTYFLLRHI